jgi:hypothetical protein
VRKFYFVTLIFLMFGAIFLLTACGLSEGGVQGNRAHLGTVPIFDAPFVFDDLEITLSSDFSLWMLRVHDIDFDGAYVLSIPITVTNIGQRGNGLFHSDVISFSPEGWSTAIVPDSINTATNIFSLGPMQPNLTKEGYIYIVYAGDGAYIIEFTNRVGESANLSFDFQFDYNIMQELSNELSPLDTIYFNGLEITFMEQISWGRILNSWSRHNTSVYFRVPVSIYNATSRIVHIPSNIDIFTPEGNSAISVGGDVGLESDEITFIDGVSPGRSIEGYLHVLFEGEGEYRFTITDSENPVFEISLSIPIYGFYDATPFANTGLSRHLSSQEMREFEFANAVTEEQEWSLAFGAVTLTHPQESLRVFQLNQLDSRGFETRLRNQWGIEDRQSALYFLIRLADADFQRFVADDIFNTFIRADGDIPRPDEIRAAIQLGTLSESLQVSLANLIIVEASHALREMDSDDSVWADIVASYTREEAWIVLTGIFVGRRIEDGLRASEGAFELLVDLFGYTREELLDLPTLAALDYSRAFEIARVGAKAGLLYEHETWPFLLHAAESASETYSGWREYIAAYILGRAVAQGRNVQL